MSQKNPSAEELKAKFNPEGSDLRLIQLRLLKILDAIDSLCRKHEIQYWLTAGNLLGSVRHGGFIPWDDDVDICMMRSDYERFLGVAKTELGEEFALNQWDPLVISPYSKVMDVNSIIDRPDNNIWRFLKYRGLYVDVFPMENSARLVSWISIRLMKNFVGRWMLRRCKSKFWLRLTNINYMFLSRFVFPIFRRFQFLAGKNLSFAMGIGMVRERRRMDCVFPLKECVFEGKNYPCPANPDAYLRGIYGDYMNMPSIDRIKRHSASVKFLK